MSFTLHGLGVSPGIAIGRVHLLSHATLEVPHLTIPPRSVDKEIARFSKAVSSVRAELDSLKASSEMLAAEVGAFVELHEMILADPELSEVPKDIIRHRRCNAEWALIQQMEKLVAEFESFDDAYLRERQQDVKQVTERLIKELTGDLGAGAIKLPKGVKEETAVLVAYDLSPTDVVAFKNRNFAAFITDVGGATSHTAILARSMAIPAVIGLHNARAMVRDGETVIVDGFRGIVLVNPDPRVLEEYQLRRSQLELERSKLRRLLTTPSKTIDGTEISLLANIELPSDVEGALEYGAEGVGLFRTEFIYLDRRDMPSEDEQFEAYRKVLKGMGGRPVVIRTFDLGADKSLHSAERTQTNPALGMRAIRYSLASPRMFHTQLRAILRASKYGKLKILIPMLAHAHEIDATLAAIELAKSSLRGEKIGFDEAVQVGGMIEIPAAALAIGMFTRRLHFLSIGTNDLIQYTLAIDRTDGAVAHLYDPLHPAVLNLIAHTIFSGEKSGIPVSLCGEMAGDPQMTRLLLGMGLRHFSMHPAQILEVKQQVLRSDLVELGPEVRRMLRHEEPSRIREYLEKINA
ncbi:MAG TPA: phosphoenolpyruvate--protein phosphotransferase [Rhodocyclaceae bacterium]|nr:phosphoenolpyruvate--protein phosphotransferase [Rhodocyclaceae bacterium]